MANSFASLKNKGMFTLSNPLNTGDVPEGSFASVKNVVVDRNDIVEPRRGFFQYGTSFGVGSDRVKQILSYKDTILRHVLSALQYDENETFINFSGSAINEVEAGLRIKSIEANGNLYFVSETGVKKISARSSADFPNISITQAGGIKALDLLAIPDYSQAGFLQPNSKVAYRIVWGTKDLNDNLILGYPSSRTVVNNISLTDSSIVDLNFTIPSNITSTNFFYQVYRTGVSSGDIPPAVVTTPADPGDEMYLVFEDTLTSAELIAGIISIKDITPEDFRRNGALLYTNPQSGGGIEQANEIPPFAKDIALYKNYTFYANTRTIQRLDLSVLSVRAMVSNSSNIIILDGTNTNTYMFQGSIETYSLNTTGCVITDFYNAISANAKYFTLDSANNEHSYYIWFKQSSNDLDPLVIGKLGIRVDILSTDTVSQALDKMITAVLAANSDFNFSGSGTIRSIICANNGYVTNSPTNNFSTVNFSLTKNGLGTGENAASNKIFLPRVPVGSENGPTTSQQLEQIARSLINVINEKDNIVYAYYISGFNDIPGQITFEQRTITDPTFYLNSNVGQEFNPSIPASGSKVISTNEISPNRIFYSKLQQPEAVPLANYIDIGPRDREIKRIIALRDSLFIFKEDGIYRLSGQTSDAFVVAPFDFSSQVLAPDTVVVLNNQIYAFSTQGVIVITDTGVSVISRPIENLLLKIAKQNTNYKTASFGVSYETDRSYLLFTVTESTDGVATQCFRYNTFTSCWTNWDVTKTCGIVNFADDTMYLGAGDLNSVEKERKSLTRMDHADREYILQIALNGVNDNILSVNSISHVVIGDVVIQKQYLTGVQFNRLLDKLDRDIGVFDSNYYISLQYLAGQDMRNSLINLATKLDLDSGIVYNNFLNDIGDYIELVSGITVTGNQTKINITGTNHILNTRYININGNIQQVIASDASSVTINTILTSTPINIQTQVNDFRDMQSCFNIINNILNLDNGVFYSNYPLSIGSVDFEMPIIGFNSKKNTITIKIGQIYLFGNITLYKAIPSELVYNPIFFGDPSMTKQIREGTMIFENSNFSQVTISYSTDLSPAYESILFQGGGLGVGDFGYFDFGSINFGGIAAPIPLRTLIPADKQRCRFMNVKFNHSVAFEKYAIYGLSLVYRGISNRGYR